MGRAILIIGAGALAVGVIIYALIECAQSDKYAVRAIPKWGWLLVILLLPVVGAVLWLFFGRPRKDDAAREPQRGRGPDDDPQFLRNLEERRKQQERARKLQEWENELKRTGRAPGERPDAEEPVLSARTTRTTPPPAAAPTRKTQTLPGTIPTRTAWTPTIRAATTRVPVVPLPGNEPEIPTEHDVSPAP